MFSLGGVWGGYSIASSKALSVRVFLRVLVEYVSNG